MKKFLLLFLLIPFFSFSQTTDEEYNYLTEGIPDQIKKGLDIKKDGYTIQSFFEKEPSEVRSIYEFRKFIDSNGKLKAISIVIKSLEPGAKGGTFYCYPIDNEKLMKKHMKRLDDWNQRVLYKLTSEAMIFLLNK